MGRPLGQPDRLPAFPGRPRPRLSPRPGIARAGARAVRAGGATPIHARCDSLSPLGERVGVRGLPDPEIGNALTPRPLPPGEGARARRVSPLCLSSSDDTLTIRTPNKKGSPMPSHHNKIAVI